MKKVLFISDIGLAKKTLPNGVNIKNRHILEYLKDMANTKIKIVDTDNWKLRVIPLFFQILCNAIKSEKVILSINSNSAYQIIKFFNYIKLHDKLIYIVVGGNLHNRIENGSLKIKYFHKIKKIFVQTNHMVKKLSQLGLKNVEHLPNSKYFEDIKVDYNKNISLPIKCFYLGRIHPDKGIDMIFEALKNVNKDGQKFQVDFFGPIDKLYKELFLKKVDKYSFAKYKGIIDLHGNTENYSKLSNYNLFLFPTFWHGEGFPGVVLDSFICGVPVVASDWNHNSEVIQDGINGLIFNTKNIKDFTDKLNLILEEPRILQTMSLNAHNESKKYKSENVLKPLDDLILSK